MYISFSRNLARISLINCLSIPFNYARQLFFYRGYLSHCNESIDEMQLKKRNDLLTYQFCSSLYNQRHKRYIIQDFTHLIKESFVPFSSTSILAKAEDESPGPVRKSGGRLGKLDAANEAGLFHKLNKSKLAKIKETLKDEPAKKSTADPAKTDAK